MIKYRSMVADYVTITTGFFTLVSGFLAISLPNAQTEQVSEWNNLLIHALAITITFFAFYFFTDQSIRTARKITSTKVSTLPNWLVYIFCYVGGFLLFFVSQIVVQSKLFFTIQVAYLATPFIFWLLIMIGLVMQWMDNNS